MVKNQQGEKPRQAKEPFIHSKQRHKETLRESHKGGEVQSKSNVLLEDREAAGKFTKEKQKDREPRHK